MTRVPYTALVGLPVLALTALAAVAAWRWLGGMGALGADELSLYTALALWAALTIAALAQLVAVPWAVFALVRNPAERGHGATAAVAFASVFALAVFGVIAVTGIYSVGA